MRAYQGNLSPFTFHLYLCSMITVETSIPVMESFYTLQGEGFHQGRAAYFIRLGGCDVGCVWCDVKESWDGSVHPMYSVSQIVREARNQVERQILDHNHDPHIVVITGG